MGDMADQNIQDGMDEISEPSDGYERPEDEIARLKAEVAELKGRLGGKERECEDYEKLLGKYLHAGEEADMDMVHLRAEVAELKDIIGEVMKCAPYKVGIWKRLDATLRERGLLEE